MCVIHRQLTCIFVCAATLSLSARAAAQHFDVQVQDVAGKLTTGAANFDGQDFSLGNRVFSRFFNSFFVQTNPGFNAVGSSFGTPPPGSSALPGDTDLFWDFLPMKVDGYVSNLLYWNGAGSTAADVSFGPAPTPTYSLSLFGEDFAQAAADGSDQLVPGQVVVTTAADGFIHIHRNFFLDDDVNPNNATVAADGVYLISMRLRMAGLDRSDPFFIVWGTPGATTAALEAADSWVTDRVDELAPSFDADFDGDLDVDGADFLTWQQNLGMSSALQIHGDADGDHAIGGGDLAVWRDEFGLSPATFPGASSAVAVAAVPEPAALTLALIVAAACGLIVLRRSTDRLVCSSS